MVDIGFVLRGPIRGQQHNQRKGVDSMHRFETKKRLGRGAKVALAVIGIMMLVFVLLPWIRQIFFRQG